MGQYKFLDWAFFRLTCYLALLFWATWNILFAQSEDPLVHRAINYKVVVGEVRLRSSKAKIDFSQADRFSQPPTVWVQLSDSTTASSPDSLRAFAVGRLSPTGFTIRSLKFLTDTCRVRWVAIGR